MKKITSKSNWKEKLERERERERVVIYRESRGKGGTKLSFRKQQNKKKESVGKETIKSYKARTSWYRPPICPIDRYQNLRVTMVRLETLLKKKKRRGLWRVRGKGSNCRRWRCEISI